MASEAPAADGGTGEGAEADTVTWGEVEDEDERLAWDGFHGGIRTGAAVFQQQQQRRLWPVFWGCC